MRIGYSCPNTNQMALTRQRKKDSHRPKRRPSREPFYQNKNVLRLKPKVFDRLREDDDFIAMIRVGRVINALNYSTFLMRHRVYQELPEEQQAIFRVRTIWVCAGYLSEGLNVIQSLQPKYHDKDFFASCLKLFEDQHKKQRKVIRDVRNSVAFHLDSDAKFTAQTLMELKLSHYEFFSRASLEDVTVTNFHLAELVDLNFLGNRVFPDDSNADILELLRLILSFSENILKASWEVVEGLGRRLDIFPSVSNAAR